MKRFARYPAGVLLFLYMLLCAAAAAEVSPAPEPWFQWGEHELAVQTIYTNPDNIYNPSPDTETFLQVRINVLNGTIPTLDIINNSDLIYLVDQDGNEYYPVTVIPDTMSFNERNSVFTTASDQLRFSLFYILPASVPLESFRMQVDLATPDPVNFYFTDSRVAEVMLQGSPPPVADKD